MVQNKANSSEKNLSIKIMISIQPQNNNAQHNAIAFNNQGIVAFQEGRDLDAENFFLKGCLSLRYYDMNSLCCKNKRGIDQIENQTTNLNYLYVCKAMNLPKVKAPSLPSESGMSFCTTADTRKVYDEGINAYKDVVSLEFFQDNESRSAVFFFNIGQIKVRSGRYDEALSRFHEAAEKLQSSNCLSTQSSATLLVKIIQLKGLCLYNLGLHDEALENFRCALEFAQSAKLSDECIAAAQNAVAVLLFHDNSVINKSRCMELFTDSIKLYKKLCGKDSVEVATLLNNIGRLLTATGEFEGAKSLFEESLLIRTKKLGSQSLDVAATSCNLGQTYHRLQKNEMAILHFKEFLQISKQYVSVQKYDIALVLRCIAEVYRDELRLKESQKYYEISLSALRSMLGELHPEVSLTINKLGNLYYEKKEMDMAMKYYRDGLAIEQQIYPSSHPHIAITLTNIAHIYRQQENLHMALATYSHLYDIRVSAVGSTHIELAKILSEIGSLHYQLQRYNKAFDKYQEALLIRHLHLENDNLEIASIHNSLGLIAYKQGNRDMAFEFFSESVRVRTKILGSDHKDLATLWYNIATICVERGDADEALRMYNESLRLDSKAIDRDYHDAVYTLQHLGLMHYRNGFWDEALESYIEALNILTSHNGETALICKLLGLIGEINMNKGNPTKMMECFSEALRVSQIRNPNSDRINDGLRFEFYILSKLHPPCAPCA